MSHHHVKLHKMVNGMLQSFAHSFQSAEEAKEFIANTPDVHSAQVYDNGNLVHAVEPQPEPVAVVEPTPAPVVETPAPVEVPAPVVEAPVEVPAPVVEAPVEVPAPVVEAPVETITTTEVQAIAPVEAPVVTETPAA